MWQRNYYKPSSFSMQIIPTFEQFELLKKGNILLKIDDIKEAMYIDHRELEENDEDVEVLVVSGYSLTQWLDRRITLYKELEKGNAETVMRNYVNRHCINPKEANRRIDNLILGTNNNLGNEIDYMSHYEPLLQEIEDIATVNELGYRIDLDLETKKYAFEVYKGLDRTVNQEVNSKAIFSTEFENVSNQKYIDSDNNYRNMVLVAGAGEDANRKTLTLGTENKGLDRYELFVDARDISDTKQNNYRNMVLVAGAGEDANRKTLTLGTENKGLDRYELFVDARDISDTKQQGESEVSIPIEEYNKLLKVRGKEKLSECTKVETFDCTLINVNSLIYRVDFDLGDKVSIINKKWGLMLNERIVSITETYDEEGLNIDIEIGNNIPTLIDKIKQKVRR